jgi:hypothetical protein
MDMIDDYQAAVLALVQGGSDAESAKATLAAFPETVGQLAPKGRELFAEEAQRIKADEFSRSPEGREQAAREALARREAHAEKVALGKVLLEEEGLSPEGMTEAEVLHHSRIGNFDATVATVDEKDAEAQRLITSGEWAALDAAGRRNACQALNLTEAGANSYAASIGAKTSEGYVPVGAEDGGGDDAE